MELKETYMRMRDEHGFTGIGGFLLTVVFYFTMKLVKHVKMIKTFILMPHLLISKNMMKCLLVYH